MLTSGVYSYLPLGLRVLKRVENIIRQEMNAAGAQELFLPCLHPMDLWRKTGRDQTLKEVMIQFKDKKGKDMCLGPTHEEIITDLAKDFIQSYRQLPVNLYQIQTKFRDEIRTRFGIVRACEFIMKDAYSFDRDVEGLKKSYALMYNAYEKIFKRCGLNPVVVQADSGAMGGDCSHEYLIIAPIGEDSVLKCPQCTFAHGSTGSYSEGQDCPECKKGKLEKKTAIELGHIFQLGTKYSQALSALYLDEDGKQKPMIMGCYGIGVSRLIAAVLEVNQDERGIIWPQEIAPFQVEILPLQVTDAETMNLARQIYQQCLDAQMDVLMDDRDETAGRKFNDADLIGIPWRIILGKKTMASGQVEVKNRRTSQTQLIDKNRVGEFLKELR